MMQTLTAIPIEHLHLQIKAALHTLDVIGRRELRDEFLYEKGNVYEIDEEWDEFEDEMEQTIHDLVVDYREGGWVELSKEVEDLGARYTLEQWYWLKYYHYPVSRIKACEGIQDLDERIKREMLLWTVDQFEKMITQGAYLYLHPGCDTGVGDTRICGHIETFNKILEACGVSLSPSLRHLLDNRIGLPTEGDRLSKRSRRCRLLQYTFFDAVRKELGLPDYEPMATPREQVAQTQPENESAKKSAEGAIEKHDGTDVEDASTKPTLNEKGHRGKHGNTDQKPKRATRARNIDAIKRCLREHIISARDHACTSQDRTGSPKLLPRPTQSQIAERLKVDTATVSRAIRDKSDREILILWQTAGDVNQIMRFKG